MAGVLTGVRVADFGHAGIGPVAAQILGSFGAEVIRVEPPSDPSLRSTPTQRGIGIVYSHANRGKKSIQLDLTDPIQLEVAYRLIKRSDVLVNNMRPGVAERLGIGYEQVSRLNPRIVYAYVSGWGTSGPMRDLPCVDQVMQAFSGWTSIQGKFGGKGEFSRAIGMLDHITSIYLVSATLLALFQRKRTGRGQRVEVTQLGSALALQNSRLAEYFAGQKPLPMGSACATTVPHEAFLCQDKRYLAVGVLHDGHWAALCRALNVLQLAEDPRFSTNPERVRNRDILIPLLQKVFASKPTVWWCIRLCKENVPHGRVYDWEMLRYHQHVVENGYIEAIDVPHQGRMYLCGNPWQYSRSESYHGVPPYRGQHTEEVLRLLGMDPSLTAKPSGKLPG